MDMLVPLPIFVPPQELEYHFQLALVPKEPPFTFNVEVFPKHIVVFPFMEVAGTEVSLTVIVKFLQIVLLQIPSALTKYVVVVLGFCVIDAPDPSKVPAQLLLYHFQLAPEPSWPPLILNVELLPWQIVEMPLTELAGNDESWTRILMFLHAVVLQVPSALTK
jgi:hypothetical protein